MLVLTCEGVGERAILNTFICIVQLYSLSHTNVVSPGRSTPGEYGPKTEENHMKESYLCSSISVRAGTELSCDYWVKDGFENPTVLSEKASRSLPRRPWGWGNRQLSSDAGIAETPKGEGYSAPTDRRYRQFAMHASLNLLPPHHQAAAI